MNAGPTATPTPRRRWLQFSLRTLSVLVLLAQNVARGGEPAAGWDDVLARHKEVLRNVEDLKDYTCALHMQEPTVDDKTLSLVMTLKVRHRPVSVYAFFYRPDWAKYSEVLFVEGRNDSRLLAHGGRGCRLPDAWFRPTNRLARMGGIRPFTQVDMRSVFQRAIDLLEKGSTHRDGEFKWHQGAKINGRVCSWLELNLASGDGDARVRTNLFVDDELQLPVRFAVWNVPAGDGDRPTLVEEYTFTDLKINVGLTDKDFSGMNPKYHFDRQTGAAAAREESNDKPAAVEPSVNDRSAPKPQCRQ